MKKKIKIIADSSCDMLEVKGLDFKSVPLTIMTTEKTFIDNAEIDIVDMLEYLSVYKGRSYTSCPSVDEWLMSYEGGDEIFVVTLSSNISGTYNSAMTAASLYLEKNPEAKIHIFDTLSAGPEVRMAVDKIAESVQCGLSFEKICTITEEYMNRTKIFFALESFHNFAQNGRVNKIMATVGKALGVRIMAKASDKGKIAIVQKYLGKKKMLNGFLEQLEAVSYAGGKVYIAHCQNEKTANALADSILSKFPDAEIKIYPTRGLCSYYAEKGGILMGFEV